ncbi:MAG TPA: 50S ribosomal protein L18e [Candidatus Nanoarchaeia archaeon]|nr:50S ribosomal protein L18e [Candidatus Nanoarchaeia archaeon]
MRTGPSNPQLQELISALRSAAYSEQNMLWKRIADDLEKPSRQRRIVNLSRINRHTEENDLVVVPGKVLASGELGHKITVAAWKFSNGAAEKVAAAKGKAISLADLLKTKDLKKVKVIG